MKAIRPVESHSGARRNILASPFGEKIFDFLKWCILVYFIFFSDGAPLSPDVAGPRVTYSLYLSLSTGLKTIFFTAVVLLRRCILHYGRHCAVACIPVLGGHSDILDYMLQGSL